MVWLHSTYNTGVAGWHAVVDDTSVYECIPFHENAWHAGDGSQGAGNRSSASLEICESGDFEQTMINAAKYSAKWLDDRGLDEFSLRQHFHWSGKNCPRLIRAGHQGWTWDIFVDNVRKELIKLAEQKDWRVIMGKEAIASLKEKGIDVDSDHWEPRLLGSMPAWAFFAFLDRIK